MKWLKKLKFGNPVFWGMWTLSAAICVMNSMPDKWWAVVVLWFVVVECAEMIWKKQGSITITVHRVLDSGGKDGK